MRYPEAGGSASFARHGFNELVSFGAGWSQLLVYVVTVTTSAFFVPHYLSIFWEPMRENPWDVVVGIVVILVLVSINVVGVQEAAALNVVLAIVDFATQLLLVLLGFFLVFNTADPRRQRPLGHRADVVEPRARRARRDARLHGCRDRLEPRRGGPRPGEERSERVQARCRRRLRDLLHAPVDRALGDAGRASRRGVRDVARPSARGRRLRERPGARPREEPRPHRTHPRRAGDLRRHPRRDDPPDRDERRCDRRVTDHLRDVELPAAPAGRSGGCTRSSARRGSRSSSSRGSRRSS